MTFFSVWTCLMLCENKCVPLRQKTGPYWIIGVSETIVYFVHYLTFWVLSECLSEYNIIQYLLSKCLSHQNTIIFTLYVTYFIFFIFFCIPATNRTRQAFQCLPYAKYFLFGKKLVNLQRFALDLKFSFKKNLQISSGFGNLQWTFAERPFVWKAIKERGIIEHCSRSPIEASTMLWNFTSW